MTNRAQRRARPGKTGPIDLEVVPRRRAEIDDMISAGAVAGVERYLDRRSKSPLQRLAAELTQHPQMRDLVARIKSEIGEEADDDETTR